MSRILTERLGAQHVEVKDVSGGCGAFFNVLVVAARFEGLPVMQQHRAVNAALEAEIGKMHGLTIRTLTPAAFAASGGGAGAGAAAKR